MYGTDGRRRDQSIDIIDMIGCYSRSQDMTRPNNLNMHMSNTLTSKLGTHRL